MCVTKWCKPLKCIPPPLEPGDLVTVSLVTKEQHAVAFLLDVKEAHTLNVIRPLNGCYYSFLYHFNALEAATCPH